jgi:short-subunit dehydrogenase
MVQRGSGAILNVASTAAFQPLPGSATYAATKAFVLALSEAMHEELKGTGVTSTAVCPGPVRTPFVDIISKGETESVSSMPSFVWTSSEDTARAAVEGMLRGRRVVIPGRLNQLTALASTHTPHEILLPVVRRFWPFA